tara:strand:+ start:1298 stop:2536 length:1239 start_codon:yes stop_codon:yes gene_type:complete
MSELALFGGKPIRTESFPTWPKSNNHIKNSLIHTLENEQWGVGSLTIDQFNNAFSKFQDAKHCISLHSGTSALWVALKAAGVKKGDEVILPAYTFIATASAVILSNAIPVFCDIQIETGNLDPEDLNSKISERTKVIIPVHVGGSPADMNSILKVASDKNIAVIEDAAQAHGATYNNIKVGALGLGGIFSFQTSKNMSSGEGGAIVTNDDEFAEACFSYHNCGRLKNSEWYEHHRLGSNLRMSALNAAMLIPQLQSIEFDMKKRDLNRKELDDFINNIDGLESMRYCDNTSRSANHIYMFRYDEEYFDNIPREIFFKAMQCEGVFTYKGWSPLYREPLFITNESEYPWLKDIDYSSLFLSNTELFAEKQVVWLRQNHLLGDKKDIKDIKNAVEKVINSMKSNPKPFLDLGKT